MKIENERKKMPREDHCEESHNLKGMVASLLAMKLDTLCRNQFICEAILGSSFALLSHFVSPGFSFGVFVFVSNYKTQNFHGGIKN